ncbi:kelch domain-containing protein 10 homolog [Pieris rapae]|uniref:kelch domain-containing protein 10 homolog n=1 Tax=Pieris rapae TaxID=64459 RepID=UPI001E27AF93|nr:kelch domain-containing protein 10 homolog [Pieris rapae]
MASNVTDFLFEPFKVIEVKFEGRKWPRPRSGHRISCDDGNVYCFGGYNPSLLLKEIQLNSSTWSPTKPLFRELWSFNVATRLWKEHDITENMPEELASNAMCINGRYLMIHGGTGFHFGNKCSNDVIIWNTKYCNNSLEVLEVTGARPPGQYGQSILCHNNYFYTIGGTNGHEYNCDIHRLDLRTKIWEPAFIGTGQDYEPQGRYRHEIAKANNKLYIIGGGTNEMAFELMEIPMFDLDNSTWSCLIPKPDESLEKTIAPLPRKCHSAVQIDTESGVQVFVVGGSDSESVFNDVWRLDLPELQWHLMQKSVLPNPLYFHSSAVTSYGCMYIFGGIESLQNATCRKNKLYKMWLCIPKLSEMCWEALHSCYPKLATLKKQELLNIGIPQHIVDRVHTG